MWFWLAQFLPSRSLSWYFGCSGVRFFGQIRCGGHSVKMGVTSREVVWLFPEQFGPEFVPVRHRLQRRPCRQCWLQKLLIVERDIAWDGLLKVLAGLEPMALQDILDPAIELDHAACLLPTP